MDELEQRRADAAQRAAHEEALAREARAALAARREVRRRRQHEADRMHMAQLQEVNEHEFERWLMTKAAARHADEATRAHKIRVIEQHRRRQGQPRQHAPY